jgi:hypothetical protein
MDVRTGRIELYAAFVIASAGALGCEGKHRPYPVTFALYADGGGAGGSAYSGSVQGEDRGTPLGADCMGADSCAAMACPESTECRIQDQPSLDSTQGLLLDAGVTEPACPGCLVDGECVVARAQNPENNCQICDPARKLDGWTASEGSACNDGLFCTIDDACDTDGKCTGSPRECDDGVACNDVSVCEEDSDSCSEPTNQCGTSSVCDVATGMCVTTCAGCVINSVCVAVGAEQPGNPCMTCQPSVSATAYSGAMGKACGQGPNECSGQDNCSAQGQCQVNHLPAGTACGDSTSSVCNQADTCDGNGTCQPRPAANGTSCEDGAFCTTGDRCLGGQCAGGSPRSCRNGEACNEAADQCQCQGCLVANTCFQIGAANPANSCQICDPARPNAFSNVSNGTPCNAVAGGSCNAGGCSAPLLSNGANCTADNQCASGRCLQWFRDQDGDGFGTTTFTLRSCGVPNVTAPPNGLIATSGDCCDTDAQAYPGQAQFFIVPRTGCGGFDYDCSAREEKAPSTVGITACELLVFPNCSATLWTDGEGGVGITPPECGLAGGATFCGSFDGFNCTAISGGELRSSCR